VKKENSTSLKVLEICTQGFILLTAILLGLSHGLYVLFARVLDGIGYPGTMNTCAVGYSAVLFAYKVVLNYNSPRLTRMWGFDVPLKHACWAELVLISLITPNASFVGHLCGIIAGLLYIHGGKYIRNISWGRRRRINNGNLGGHSDRSPPREQHQRREDHRPGNEDADIQEAVRRSLRDEEMRRRRLERFR